jgi:hypothetical protein
VIFSAKRVGPHWAAFWAISSPTRLVTLSGALEQESKHGNFGSKSINHRTAAVTNWSFPLPLHVAAELKNRVARFFIQLSKIRIIGKFNDHKIDLIAIK